MSDLELRCLHCGAINQLEEETNDYFVCSCCGSKNPKDKSKELVKRIKELNLQEETKQLSNYRLLLSKSIHNNDYNDQKTICNKILYINPNDFEATFYKVLSNQYTDSREFESFIQNMGTIYSIYEIEPLLETIIHNIRFYELETIHNFIINNKLNNSYLDLLEQRKEEINNQRDLYASIDRDVFICHSSKDNELLMKVVKELEEEQGFDCWYSERNMPKNTPDYWETIEENIQNCKVFLFLITENSKFSRGIKEELKICKKINKSTIVALYAMDSNPGIEIERFLSRTGTQWIDIKEKDAFDLLALRIYNLLQDEEVNIQEESNKNYKEKEMLSCLNDGKKYYDNKQFVEAVKRFKIVADFGNAIAQYYLAYCYSYGYGIEQDYMKAFDYYLLSANQGYLDAQANIGYAYDVGQGIQQDYKEANKWYKLAADKGHKYAQYNLGLIYDYGKGVEVNNKKAFDYYLLSATQGHSGAQANIGYAYDVGKGVEQDSKEANKWYKLAADQGHKMAQYNLGVHYEIGRGVKADYKEAKKWYQLAAKQGLEKAIERLKIMD